MARVGACAMSELVGRAKASLEGVAEGPWSLDPEKYADTPYGKYRDVDGPNGGWIAHAQDRTHARFIITARQLVPELIAEVERLERALEGRVWELERERDSHLETAAIMRRTRERAERLEAALQSSIHTGLHPESLCGNDCSGCVSPAEGGY